jgi:two-component system chemotaxis sensor kinase CheA
MAVKSTLLCELDSQVYAIPLSYTESVISLSVKDIHQTGRGLIAVHLDQTIQVVFLSAIFNEGRGAFEKLSRSEKVSMVVVNFNGRKVGLVVDKLLQQKEIVERPLFKPVDSIAFLSGLTILGNGSVCLSLNIPGLLARLLQQQNAVTLTPHLC